MIRDTSGPTGHNVGFRLPVRRGEAAREGIARGSKDGDQCADRQAQQCAATDARAVGNHVAEFHSAARREVLTGFEESSEDEHRKACYDSSASIPESDHRQE